MNRKGESNPKLGKGKRTTTTKEGATPENARKIAKRLEGEGKHGLGKGGGKGGKGDKGGKK